MKYAPIAASLVLFSVASLGFSQPDAQKTLQSQYDRISALSMKKDKVKLEKMIRKNASSEFEYIDSMKNSLDLAATVRQNTEQLNGVYKFNSNENKIIGMKKVGNSYVCTIRTTYDVFADSKKKNRVQGVSLSQDTWIKTIAGWKIRKSQILKATATNNGKPIKI